MRLYCQVLPNQKVSFMTLTIEHLIIQNVFHFVYSKVKKFR